MEFPHLNEHILSSKQMVANNVLVSDHDAIIRCGPQHWAKTQQTEAILSECLCLDNNNNEYMSVLYEFRDIWKYRYVNNL